MMQLLARIRSNCFLSRPGWCRVSPRPSQAAAIGALALSTVVSQAQLQVIRQGRDSANIPESNDRYGHALAVGDFNGDGYQDVAVGSPGEGTGVAPTSPRTGAVIVNRGGPWGINWEGAAQLFPSDSPEIGLGATDFGFGGSLAAGDLNNDGFADLAVGCLQLEKVLVYRGGANGLAKPPQVIDVEDFGFTPGANDRFGAALAFGRLGTDAFDDLLIGSPGRNQAVGAVFALKGGASGLSVNPSIPVIRPDDVPAAFLTAGQFGAALAIGNVGGFDYDDILIGAPASKVGLVDGAGAIAFIPGSDTASGFTPAAGVVWSEQDFPGYVLQPGGQFGLALAVGDLWGDDGHQDLAVGSPSSGPGRVFFVKGQLIPAPQAAAKQGTDALPTGSRFGSRLAAGDATGDGIDDLAIGVPQATAGFGTPWTADSGVVYIYPGTASGPTNAPGQRQLFWSDLVDDQPEGGEQCGNAIAFGRVSNGTRHSLLIGCPGKDAQRGEVVDYSPWRQPAAPRCVSALAVNCEGDVVYALRPFERVGVASTTKIVTVLIGCERTQLPPNNANFRSLSATYAIESWMGVGFPPATSCSVFQFPPNDVVTFEDLLRSCVMVSGNDSAMAIADVVTGEISAWNGTDGSAPLFVQLMNTRAAAIGMNDTLFTNPPGVDAGSPYSTAWDMMLLARTAMQNPLFRDICGRNSYLMNHQIPTGLGPGSTQLGTEVVTYSWLAGLRNAITNAVGIKPGSTPGAGRTRVMAARDPHDPSRLVFANGFGWTSSTLAGRGETNLLQLALNLCPKPPPAAIPNPSLAVPMPPVDPKPGGPGVIAFQPVDQGDPDDPSGLSFAIDIQGTEPEAARDVRLKLDYRVLFSLAPAGTRDANGRLDQFRIAIGAIRGFDEIYIGNTEDQPDASLNLLYTGKSAPQAMLLPAVQKVREAAAAFPSATPFDFELTNTGTNAVIIAVDFNGLDIRPQLAPRIPYRSETGFDLSLAPIREGLRATLVANGTVNPPGELYLVRQAGNQRLVIRPPIELTGREVSFRDTNAVVSLEWTAPAQWYNSFAVLHKPTLSAAAWTELGIVPAETNTIRTWSGTLPAAASGFFQVEGRATLP